MISPIDLSDPNEAQAVLALQLVSYRVEADLIGSEAIPPLHDTLETLQTCGETFFGYRQDDRLIGAVSYKREEALLDIHRLMVDSAYFRQGIARMLIERVLEEEQSATRAIVQTGSRNVPARALYRRLGFTALAEVVVAPGLIVTRFERVF